MKKALAILSVTFFITGISHAQLSVTATGTNGNCLADATITATVKGNAANDVVYYQLLQDSLIVRLYQASNVFSNLPAGTYAVRVIDSANNKTAKSSSITLTTTYKTLSISVPTVEVGCSAASNDSMTITASGGKTPYTYAITAGPVTYPNQSSNKFYNLPVGIYTITVTDGCGTTISTTSSVYATSTTVKDIIAGWGVAMITYGNYTNGDYNNCAAGAFVNSDGGFQYSGSGGGALTTFDQNHFYWRYQYPSKSGNIYGMGGVLNGDSIPVTTRSVPMPASATYPFSAGDIIIYDQCGNSYTNVGMLKSSSTYLSYFSGIYDCSNGGGVNINTTLSFNTICIPVTYTFTDKATGSTVSYSITNAKTFLTGRPWPMSIAVYGFAPGHTYSITATDGQGHTVTTATSVTIPSTQGSITSSNINVDFNYYNSSWYYVTYPITIAANSIVSYTVIASNSPNVQVGYSKSFSYSADVISGGQFYGPNSDNSWPAGTYTVQVTNSPCLSNSTFSFTIPVTFKGIFNNNTTITPECGTFDVSLQAALDSINVNSNVNTYSVKIIKGPSNVGLIKAFNTTPVSKWVYNSLNFNGLSYGTYVFGLIAKGGSTPISYDTITYTADDALNIDALSTGGYTCTGQTTSKLIISANSASETLLQYSMDNGGTWQDGNVFNNVAVGTYIVVVKDACGNRASYNASVIPSSQIVTQIVSVNKTDTVCAGSTVWLRVNAIGADSYAWTGPNGFSSTIRNPIINNVQPSAAGTYTIVVTSPFCTVTDSAKLTVNLLPTATVSYNGSPFCATGTVSPTITGTTGGTFSSTAGLSINASTGVINLSASNAGTYTVTYSFADAVTGCSNTATTNVTVNTLPLVVTTAQSVCIPNTVNLTTSSVTTGSTLGLSYGYYTDAVGTSSMSSPAAVAVSGIYYIKGTSSSTGCFSIAPVTVNINSLPTILITNPATACVPNTVDLTASSVTAGSSPNLSFAYYRDSSAISILTNPQKVSVSGTYYIQGTNTITGCVSAFNPVLVLINSSPTVNPVSNDTVCNNGMVPAINFSSPATDSTITYNWTNNNTAIGLDGSGGSSIPSFKGTNNTLSPITGTIKVTPVAPGNSCAGIPAVFTITVLPASTSTTNVSICSTSLPYVWNGNNYSAAGTYTVHLTNVLGCDSAATLNLTVLPASTSTTNISIYSTSLPYIWNSNNYNAAGTYTVHLTNALGCDSAATLNLTVLIAHIVPIPEAGVVSTINGGIAMANIASNDTISGVVATVGTGGNATVSQNGTWPAGIALNSTTGTISVQAYTIPGIYLLPYTLCDRLTPVNCATTTDTVIVTSIPHIISLTKTVGIPQLQNDGTFLLLFTISANNLYPVFVDSVQIYDDLNRVFPSPIVYNVVSITPSGILSTNSLYDGNMQTGLLNPGQSSIKGPTTDSIQILVRADPRGFSGTLTNNTNITGVSAYGNVPANANTSFNLPAIDIEIPQVFTPNHDGINDAFVIRHSSTVSISLEVYNRWGNIVYKNANYKNDWTGTGTNNFLGKDLEDGTYYYIVKGTNIQPGAAVINRTGFLEIKR